MLEISNWSYINIQDATSPLIEQLIIFHDHTLIILIIITSIVTYIMTFIISVSYTHLDVYKRQESHYTSAQTEEVFVSIQ